MSIAMGRKHEPRRGISGWKLPEAFEFIDLEDRAVVIDGAVGSIPLAVFQAAARECPERALIISETAAAS